MLTKSNKTLCVCVCFFFFSVVNDVKGKQKILGSNQKLKFNPTELILYCKDFRIIRFRFDEAGPESAKKVQNTRKIINLAALCTQTHSHACSHTSVFQARLD